ncbi:glutaredoxin family protein [Caenimonas soli]|uniref:glutaredoxin family protein n=1 Tax=Caenimonas soli TaxID=2735555 RepID=UPI001557DB38|nr:glutaredoxin family protein [Caenimonas soli]NPC56276.1 glutaredoxin family protein [Caenimonas soli]
MKRLHLSWLWALLLLVAGAAQSSNLDKTTTLEQLSETPLPAQVLAFQAEMERNLAQQRGTRANARSPGHLRLFSAQWCGYCRQAQAWLAANQVPYQNLDIDTPEGMSEFARSGKKGGIPLLLGSNVEIRGFSAGSYRAALRPDR